MKTLLLVSLFAYSSVALALGDPVTDPRQVLGCWKRQVYSDEAMTRISTFDFYDPIQQKFQWFCFNESGEFRTLTINKDNDLKATDIAKYVANLPTVMTWKLLGRGVVRVEHKQDPSQTLNWLVSFARKPERIDQEVTVAEGALFMGLINKERTRYALLRVLRKVE